MSVDTRTLKSDQFITDEVNLLRIESVKTIGTFPKARMIVWAEDAVTMDSKQITEAQLKEFRIVIPCE